MEGLLNTTDFTKLVVTCLGDEWFTLFDIGCSGGIDLAWRCFGDRLQAFGFDPNLRECERLAADETLMNVHYVPSFVGLPSDHAFLRAREGRPPVVGNPWHRLSTARSIEIRQQASQMDAEQLRDHNLWEKTRLADAHQAVILPDFAQTHGILDVDFIKIDVDGEDFAILNSIDQELATWNVLGLGLEVNFFGSDNETDHTFHNMDRFMRRHGFDLFSLTVRRYSFAAVPSVYEWHNPAHTRTGRPLQGDAIYLRDICIPEQRTASDDTQWYPAKVMKLAAIASLAGLPDYAGEIVSKWKERIEGFLDVPTALDLLTAQAQIQSRTGTCFSYRDYMAAFEADDAMYYSKCAGAYETEDVTRDAYVDELKAHIVAMRNSTSWRLTGPLRRLSRFLHRRYR